MAPLQKERSPTPRGISVVDMTKTEQRTQICVSCGLAMLFLRRELLHERYHASAICKAGQKNCLRAVCLLAPRFLSRARSPTAPWAVSLKERSIRKYRNMSSTPLAARTGGQGVVMYGFGEFADSDLVEHMDQILYNLNLLSCSWAAISCGMHAGMHACLTTVSAQIWCHCHRW